MIKWLRKQRAGARHDHFVDVMREGIIRNLREPRGNARASATEARNAVAPRTYGPAAGATA